MQLFNVLASIACSVHMLQALGCTSIETKAANLTEKPDGIRVYPSKVYLLVDKEKSKSVIMYAPDYKRAYDIKPTSVFAKHDFSIDIDEGQVKKITSNQDGTAFLTFFEGAVTTAAKAAGVAVSASPIEGNFGLDSGIYQLQDDGRFLKIQIQ